MVAPPGVPAAGCGGAGGRVVPDVPVHGTGSGACHRSSPTGGAA